jgi:hypothetical protein
LLVVSTVAVACGGASDTNFDSRGDSGGGTAGDSSGGSSQGGSAQGGTSGAASGSSGSSQGGSQNGGSQNGGSQNGGSQNGGSQNGGSSGSETGGSSTGGSSTGGSSTGGAAGTDAGGGTAGVPGGSGPGGAGGVSGSAGSGGENCTTIVTNAQAALRAAQVCNLAISSREQCQGTVEDLCGCTVPVNDPESTATKSYLAQREAAVRCGVPCLAIVCQEPTVPMCVYQGAMGGPADIIAAPMHCTWGPR